MISIVFDRKDYLEDCDLLNFGGLGSMKYLYQEEIENRYVDLIRPQSRHQDLRVRNFY